jgi:glycyl-tRNA synthetase
MKEMEENGQIVIKAANKEITLSKDFVSFEAQEKTVQEEKYTPSVIEPSFGIGRIVYCIFEHCFRIRPDNVERTFF